MLLAFSGGGGLLGGNEIAKGGKRFGELLDVAAETVEALSRLLACQWDPSNRSGRSCLGASVTPESDTSPIDAYVKRFGEKGWTTSGADDSFHNIAGYSGIVAHTWAYVVALKLAMTPAGSFEMIPSIPSRTLVATVGLSEAREKTSKAC